MKFLLELKKNIKSKQCTKVTRYLSANVLKKHRAHKRLGADGVSLITVDVCSQVSTMTLSEDLVMLSNII